MKRGLIFGLALLAACGSSGSRRESAGETEVYGAVCGVAEIRGVAQAPMRSDISALCGIENPVRVAEVSGVRLSQPALLNCTAARSLNRWVAQTAKPAVAELGERLDGLQVAAHYACRPRNSQRGARISEHGRGNAIDVSAFRLASGGEVSVLRDWGQGAMGRALTRMRKGACGPFGVVLGPGSDPFHSDHFHMDVSNLRNRYCN